MSRSARQKKHDEEKANKALGGAKLKANVESSAISSLTTSTASMAVSSTQQQQQPPAAKTRGTLKHSGIELQWFKLLRGDDRLRQIANILVECRLFVLFFSYPSRNFCLENLKVFICKSML